MRLLSTLLVAVLLPVLAPAPARADDVPFPADDAWGGEPAGEEAPVAEVPVEVSEDEPWDDPWVGDEVPVSDDPEDLAPAPARTRQPATPPRTTGGPAANVPYGALIAATARRYGLSVSLFTALVWKESGFDARARSKAGARGLTQLMPATARSLGVRRIYDPAQNLDGGARYLRAQLVRFRSVRLALAAYNTGPGAVRRAGLR